MEDDAPVDKSVDNPVDAAPQHASEAERLAAQKKRSLWLALALFGFVILIGVTSVSYTHLTLPTIYSV